MKIIMINYQKKIISIKININKKTNILVKNNKTIIIFKYIYYKNLKGIKI